MKKIIHSTNAPAPIGPYSQAVLANGTLYISGQIAIDPATQQYQPQDVRSEAEMVMKNLQAILTEAGIGFSHVVKTNIFLADMNDFATVNEVYGGYFQSDFPARETVQVSVLPKNCKVEISMIAVL
ncbi:MAG: RidA family protein [Flavobacteriales bacterium]|nr:RidA family protein [Flavobacteriales bacterium]